MECKLWLFIRPNSSIWELIETLWNVNTGISSADTVAITELIETLWNVNKSKQKFKEEKF